MESPFCTFSHLIFLKAKKMGVGDFQPHFALKLLNIFKICRGQFNLLLEHDFDAL